VVSKPFSGLLPNTDYYVRFRYTGTTLGASGWSPVMHAHIKLKIMAANEIAKFQPVSPVTSEQFGSSVAFSEDGSYAVVGAMRGKGTGKLVGWFRGYRKSGSAWALEDEIAVPSAVQADVIGTPMALAEMGRLLAIGASGDAVAGVNAGAVRLLVQNNTTWSEAGVLRATDAAAAALFGRAVAMNPSGSHIVWFRRMVSPEISSAIVSRCLMMPVSRSLAHLTTASAPSRRDWFMSIPEWVLSGHSSAPLRHYSHLSTRWSVQRSM